MGGKGERREVGKEKRIGVLWSPKNP